MKKMTTTEARKVNGGFGYRCRTNRYCTWYTFSASAMGWHFLLSHPNERNRWAYQRVF